jgi:hypothetical protein
MGVISFGVNRLRAYTNGIGSSVAVSAATGSCAVTSGSVWIGGVEAVCSAQTVTIASAASTNTGNMAIIAYLAAGDTATATLSFATGSSPTYLYRDVSNVAVIAKGQFGTGTSTFSTAANQDLSGLTGMRPFGRAQNGSINVTYDQAVARGGNLVFPTDVKLYNGNIDGTLEYAVISGANLAKIIGADWTSGGATTGTLTLSSTQAPLPFMIEFVAITNGDTATWRIPKCYSNSLTFTIDRENYTMPTLNFQAVANQAGNILTVDSV